MAFPALFSSGMQPCLPTPIQRESCSAVSEDKGLASSCSRSVVSDTVGTVVKRGEVRLSNEYPHCEEKWGLVLREKILIIEQSKLGQKYVLYLEDLIGLKLLDEAQSSKLFFPAKLITCSKNNINGREDKRKKREIGEIRLYFYEGARYEANRCLAVGWRQAIQLQCRKCNCCLLPQPTGTSHRLLVIVNPVSGTGKSEQQYNDLVKPMFDVAGLEVYKTIFTQRRRHAKDEMSAIDITQINGIVVFGGDGTLYEVINGLMSREDWETSIKTPIGVIPTGSGNGLISSVLHELGEECTVIDAAFQIIRGNTRPVDLASVHTSGEKMHMFLSVTWGLVGDIDIESEWMRFLGEFRLVIGTVQSIIKKRIYNGRISYLPNEIPSLQPVLEIDRHEESTPNTPSTTGLSTNLLPSLSEPVPSDWVTIEGGFVGVIVAMVPWLSPSYMCHSDVSLGSGDFFIILMRENMTRVEVISALLSLNFDKLQVIRTCAWRIEPLSTPGHLVVDGEVVSYGPIQAQVHKHFLNVFCSESQIDQIR